jgi:tripeptidyl-peptidase I
VQEFHLWKHAQDGDVLLRTTHYSLPEYLYAHVEFVQPTTYFARPKAMHTTFNSVVDLSLAVPGLSITLNTNLTISINVTIGNNSSTSAPNGTLTDPILGVSCTSVITISCLQQLYNAVGYKPAATNKNAIGVTGYLGQFANTQDLQSFYALERPEAINSSFQTVLVNSMYIYSFCKSSEIF